MVEKADEEFIQIKHTMTDKGDADHRIKTFTREIRTQESRRAEITKKMAELELEAAKLDSSVAELKEKLQIAEAEKERKNMCQQGDKEMNIEFSRATKASRQ